VLPRRANQVHPIASLRLDEIGRRDRARIDEMLIGEEVLLSQAAMDRREAPLIAEAEQEWSRHG
jgi:hypothetical protein